MSSLSPFGGAVCFDDERYDVADLVLLALAEGHWQSLEVRLAHGLALEREYGRDVAPSCVAEEVKEFRYGRRLISGKELREWLAARSLFLTDLRRHCLRNVLIAEHGIHGDGVPEMELADVMVAEAIMSGTLRAAAARLGDLAAMAAAAGARAEPSGMEVAELLHAAAAHPAAGLVKRGDGDLERRAARIVGLLHAEPVFLERVVTPRAMARCFAEHGIDWLRVECSELTLASEGAARESMLCLRLDGTSLPQLSRQLETGLRVREHYVGDFLDGTGSALASAALGDPVGPFAADAGWRVLVVNRRVAPSSDDPELVRRASTTIAGTARERIKAGRVRELAAL